MYNIKLTKQAEKDAIRIERAGLKLTAIELINIVKVDPFQKPPLYETLKGDRQGAYSRRINRQHRFVYEVLPNIDNLKDENGTLYQGIIKIIRMWTHYE
jgi:Txe/YoeB family toxin of toxin-antitoxin system